MSGFGFTFKGGEVAFRMPLDGRVGLRVGGLALSLWRIQSGPSIRVQTEPTLIDGNFKAPLANIPSVSRSSYLHVGGSLLLFGQGLVVRGIVEGLDDFYTAQLVDPPLQARLREEAAVSQVNLALDVLPDSVRLTDHSPADTFAGVSIFYEPNLSAHTH